MKKTIRPFRLDVLLICKCTLVLVYTYTYLPIQYLILILYLYYRKAADRITDYYNGLMSVNCKPLTMGGDHFVSYPILRAIAAKHGPVCTYTYVEYIDPEKIQSCFWTEHIEVIVGI